MQEVYRYPAGLDNKENVIDYDPVRKLRLRDVVEKCGISKEEKLTKCSPKSHKTSGQHLRDESQLQNRHVHQHHLHQKLQQIQPSLHQRVRFQH